MLCRYLGATPSNTRQRLVSSCCSRLGLRHQQAAAAGRRPGGRAPVLERRPCPLWQNCSTADVAADTAQADSMATDYVQPAMLLHLIFEQHARLTVAAQQAWYQVLEPGDTAVDATCGNGHDTLALARAVGPSGKVYGIDIQEDAIAATRERLEQALPACARPELHLVRTCHSRLQEVVGSGRAKVVAFNCGYLPKGDKAIITTTSSTVAAIEAALEVVCPGGVISITAYIGHPGGEEEYVAVRAMIASLSSAYWTSTELRLLNRPKSPILLMVWRYPDMFKAGRPY